MFTRKPSLQLGKIVITSAKRLLQQYLPHADIRDVAATRELLLLRGVGEAQSRGR